MLIHCDGKSLPENYAHHLLFFSAHVYEKHGNISAGSYDSIFKEPESYQILFFFTKKSFCSSTVCIAHIYRGKERKNRENLLQNSISES